MRRKMVLRRCLAALSAGAVMFCSAGFTGFASCLNAAVNAGTAVDPADETFTLTFNLEGLTQDEDADFSPRQIKGGDGILIPIGKCYKTGYYFNGWTLDGIRLFQGYDVFYMPYEDVTLQPVLQNASDKTSYTVSYETVDAETGEDYRPGDSIKPKILYPNACHAIEMNACKKAANDYEQSGWTDGVNVFKYGQKMIMPAHDVILRPNWLKYFDLTYDAGDVDGIIGSATTGYSRYETHYGELAAADKLSRAGYKIMGWLCDYDGLVYRPSQMYRMPASDVRMYAIWDPVTYTLTFVDGTKWKNYSAKCGSDFELPTDIFTKEGQKIVAWECQGVTYKVGEPFKVPAAKMGSSLELSAVWGSAEDDSYNVFELAKLRQLALGGGNVNVLAGAADFILGR